MINLIKIGLLGLFVNYYPINIYFGHPIPGGTYLFIILITIGVIGSSGKIFSDSERAFNFWIVFLILSLLTSPFAVNTSVALKGIEKYAVRIWITFAVFHVCILDRDIKFPISLLSIIAILTSIIAFTRIGSISSRMDLTTEAVFSTNDIGSMMVYGCFAIILFFRNVIKNNSLLRIGLIAFTSIIMIIIIFISGSRKSLLSLFLFYVLMVIFVWLKESKKISTGQLLSIFIVSIIVICVANKYLIPNMENTSVYNRLFGTKAEQAASSDQVRILLYKQAIGDFFSSPIWGVGFNNFGVVHQMYTHSTYVEPLSCTGCIGFLYLIPIFSILLKQINLTKITRNTRCHSTETELLIFYIIFLLIGLGIPFIYKDVPCIIFGMMIAHQKIFFERFSVAVVKTIPKNYLVKQGKGKSS